MIKIIKQGTRRKAECDECGCVFSFEDEDVKKDCVRMRHFVECPQCRVKMYIADTNLEKWSPEPLSSDECSEQKIFRSPKPLTSEERDELKRLKCMPIKEGSEESRRLQELMWKADV